MQKATQANKHQQNFRNLFADLELELNFYSKELERLQTINIQAREPDENFSMSEVEYMIFVLSDGEIAQATVIEETDIERCYNWMYLNRIKRLNEMKRSVAELEKMKKK